VTDPDREAPRRTLVIVPALNEAASVGVTVAEIRAASAGLDVVVIDDGSTDETATVAMGAGAEVISLPFNIGVGGAMRTGFVYALRLGYDAVVQVDADGQHDPADIERVLAGLSTSDISIGARFAGVGDYAVRGPRWWAMRLLARSLSRISRTTLTDVTSGFRAANRRALQQYVRYYPSEYLGDTLDSLVAAIETGLTVTQVPVAMRARRHGTSTQSTWNAAVYLIRAVFALGLSLLRRPFIRRVVAG
jgi:glycosyltransferase involved in cell wall biosynthesis